MPRRTLKEVAIHEPLCQHHGGNAEFLDLLPFRMQAIIATSKVGIPKPRPTPRAIRLLSDMPCSGAGSKLMTAAVVVYERSSVVGFPFESVVTVEDVIVRFTTNMMGIAVSDTQDVLGLLTSRGERCGRHLRGCTQNRSGIGKESLHRPGCLGHDGSLRPMCLQLRNIQSSAMGDTFRGSRSIRPIWATIAVGQPLTDAIECPAYVICSLSIS